MLVCDGCTRKTSYIIKGFCKKCYHKRWRKNNPKKHKEHTKRWLDKNPEYFKNYQRKIRKVSRTEELDKAIKRILNEE